MGIKDNQEVKKISGKGEEFLTSKFNKGVETGQKPDPGQVAKEIRQLTDETGTLVFSSEE